VPQAPTHNRQAWRLLEEYARKLVEQGNELYIIAGTAGKGGEGDNGKITSLASGKLTVPAALWKVIVVLPAERMM
jgi:endonuclease G